MITPMQNGRLIYKQDFGHHSCPCPDTITAYSLEDNELWLRHLLGLVVHVGVAFTSSYDHGATVPLPLRFAIPIFITGIIKYGERTFMLRSSNAQRFKNSLLSNPDPALVLFSVIIDIHAYSSMDVSITYILLIGAVVLEVYAFCVLLFSDWTALWWSRSMAQYNLVSSCLHKVQPRWFGVQMLPWIGDLLEKYQCLSWEDVDKDIEEMIFKQLIEKSNEIKDDLFNIESCRILLAKRGDYVLEKKYVLHDQFSWSTTTVDLIIAFSWHIATDLCYYSDLDDIHRGIGEIRYRDMVAEALRFFMDEESENGGLSVWQPAGASVLLKVAGLSLEPMVVWRALCENLDSTVSSNMSEVKAIHCLAGCEVEFIRALPFQEYSTDLMQQSVLICRKFPEPCS
ncbi:hypothetical protein EZV62_003528 [Acer yangbiense]|uniref:DUF4220 domain-containing protein n=1 Tax=Acer yangbiense TaxID=1000413 RepID=A0A5C7IH47_9ROSI|nr:hypothetical protein EZV62_003528 [Acer yangbiense]